LLFENVFVAIKFDDAKMYRAQAFAKKVGYTKTPTIGYIALLETLQGLYKKLYKKQ
jgi:hypothetical protein